MRYVYLTVLDLDPLTHPLSLQGLSFYGTISAFRQLLKIYLDEKLSTSGYLFTDGQNNNPGGYTNGENSGGYTNGQNYTSQRTMNEIERRALSLESGRNETIANLTNELNQLIRSTEVSQETALSVTRFSENAETAMATVIERLNSLNETGRDTGQESIEYARIIGEIRETDLDTRTRIIDVFIRDQAISEQERSRYEYLKEQYEVVKREESMASIIRVALAQTHEQNSRDNQALNQSSNTSSTESDTS